MHHIQTPAVDGVGLAQPVANDTVWPLIDLLDHAGFCVIQLGQIGMAEPAESAITS